MTMPSLSKEPIALVGCSIRFPGANSLSKLWELLRMPRDILEEFPSSRMNLESYYHPNGEHHGTTNVQKSYLISQDHRLFDAAFFNITPLEAEAMDPQQRILLEVVYEAMESAGLTIEAMKGSQTSVFVGVMSSDYSTIQLRDGDTMPKYAATGAASSILSNRISYFFDWKGPSITIDTACSSSLVAVHQAIQSLRNCESSLAVVAGANLILTPEPYIAESKLHMLSPDSRSRMWDIKADGYARGDGFAAVMLKTLSQALKDGDHIESVIRETMVGSDGRTTGITMPSASAQAALIRQTYHRAGLDCRLKTDRCQYFEAHGTGTPAGDPTEAKAVRDAFFPDDDASGLGVSGLNECLYIGSIKTVTGHLEGSAGLAGLLKASLIVQHGVIPPNLHFELLNPAVAPFCTHLTIPTVAHQWPDVPTGSPRRVSVNSFGFGGTNAHAIVESYDPEYRPPIEGSHTRFVGPLTFSANSESSLITTIEAFSSYLKANDSVSLADLSWSLQSRRTVFPVRAAFSGVTRESLLASMDERVQRSKETSSNVGIQSRRISPETSPRIIGIFTGQGAQWPQMGRELLLASEVFEGVIEDLQRSLAALPDPPSWSLKAELTADAPSSRIYEASVAQPLCTAVQIALVDLLRCAGVSFNAVVGHSSGEIAAAYAADILSSSDAIRIAYYRGYHATSASGAGDCAGAMMAVGIPFSDALSFCQTTQFKGRLSVAASNAPASVTLSGDADAIREAQAIFEEEKCSAKLLQVNRAYHSYHMHPCVEPYMRSIRACNIQVQPGRSSCVWTSSVNGNCIIDMEPLKDVYWTDNMVRPVLFSQALERAMRDGVPDMMVEVGPHPALKGPIAQTIKSTLDFAVPYCSLMRRDNNDVETFSGAVGYIWENLGRSSAIDFDGYRHAFKTLPDEIQPRLLKDLPAYSWDHKHLHWKESRISRNSRFPGGKGHELLGRRCPDDSAHEMRWRNILRLEELPWLRGHSFQGQIVFPGAAFVVMALEASKSLSRERPVMFTELHDITMSRAIIIGEDSVSIETNFTLRCLEDNGNALTAHFMCSSCPEEATATPRLNCSGGVRVILGEPSNNTLPPRLPKNQSMTVIDIDRFYRSLSELGLEYSGLFRSLTAVKRTTNMSTSSASWSRVDMDSSLVVHPALLDVAFQSIFASTSAVASVLTPYLPSHIRRVRVNNTTPTYAQPSTDLKFTIDAYTTNISPASRHSPPVICGDIDIFGEGDHVEIQIEGLSLRSISETNPSSDRRLFSQTVWDVDISSGIATVDENKKDSFEESELPELLERLSHLYFRELREKTPRESIANFAWYHQRLFEFIDHLLLVISGGQHPIIRKEWASDTREQLFEMLEKFPETMDLRSANAVAENFPAVLQGEITMLEVLTKDDMLSRLYNNALGLSRGHSYIARMAKQIAHRYPRLKVFEIGAGTGATTSRVLDSINGAFSSYVYTDISTGFFEKARERFAEYSNRMIFKAFNVEKDLEAQGFIAHSFDVVVAASVLHATRSLKHTMENVRRLLRPGGFLLLLEPTGDSLRTSFVMCGLPGWWLGGNDGRRLFPGITALKWDTLLRETGFSGIDSLSHDTDESSKHMYSAIVSQALDDRFNMIRQPLLSPELVPQIEQFLIIGGKTLKVSRLIQNVCGLLQMWKHCTLTADDLNSLGTIEISSATTVLCLTELDKPVFESITIETFRAMQQLFNAARRVLWVTQGCKVENPYSNMTIGMARVLLNEMPHIDLQMLDIGSKQIAAADGRVLAEILLRLVMKDLSDHDMLWSTEPEIALEAGMLLIPRIIPDKDLNDRLNSSRRSILKKVSATTSVIHVRRAGRTYCLQQGKPVNTLQLTLAGHRAVRVSYSLLHPVKIVAGTCLYLCLGSVIGTGQRVVVLSRSNSSSIETLADWMCPCEVSKNEEVRHLQSIAAELVAQNLLSSMSADAVLLLNQPEVFLADIVARRALQVGVKVVCTTSQLPLSENNLWTYIHPLAPQREIKKVLPINVMRFVDWSEKDHDSVGHGIKISLPRSCEVHEPIGFFGGETKVDTNVSASVLQQSLTAAILHSTTGSISKEDTGAIDQVMAEDLSNVTAGKPSICIIDWTKGDAHLVDVKPLDPKEFLFRDKTYLLVGLTGDLGQSLCRWMVLNGARNLVLTSRHANVDSRWLEEMRNMGTDIRVFPMDITNKQALLAVHSEICSTMPPISGIVNGAMVLSDAIFVDMTFEALTDVLRPKVEGSKNLDELFRYQHLDFFIMFSSVSAAAGDRGQSNYAAANMFMAGLAAQRRHRGLAASVIDIGMLTEIGYVARAGRGLEEYLRRRNHCLPISEPEFHQMFTEAILAGRPDSGHLPEIITGLQGVRQSIDGDSKPPWFYNPRLSHCVLEEAELVEQQGETAIVHIHKQLADAASAEEATEILRKAFSSRLAAMLQLGPHSIDEKAPLIQLGIDSLIAIEIRSWFIKEVQVDVPVLEMLSGNTIAQICQDVVAKLFASAMEKSAEVASRCEPKFSKDANPASSNNGNSNSGDTPMSFQGDSTIGTPSEMTPSSSPPISKEYSIAKLTGIQSNERRSNRLGSRSNEEYGGNAMSGGELSGNFQTENTQVATPINGGKTHALPARPSVESKAPPVLNSQNTVMLPALVPSTMLSSETRKLHPRPQEVDLNFERVERMSYAQSRLWFLKTYSEDPTSYNVVLSYDITGPLHIPRFKKAFETAVFRHKSFQTCFFMQIETGEGMQGVLRESSVILEHRQISDEGEVQEEFDRMRNNTFELEKGKTFQATLLSRTPSWNTIVFGYHHILMDASSFFMFLRDLDKAYRMQPLIPQINQYLDFAANQRLLIERGELADDLAFWKNEFSDLPEPLPLFRFSRVRSRFVSNAYGMHTVDAVIPQSYAIKIKQTSQQLGITPFHFHLAAVQSLLVYFLDVEDICIGIADANRMDRKFLETLGVFLNLLPIRLRRIDPRQTFTATAKNASRKVYEALAHSRLPFDVLLDELNVPRSPTHTPLFQVFVNYRMGALHQASLGECELRHRAVNDARFPYDLLVTITEPTKDSCYVSLTVRDDLYTSDACSLLVKSYIHLLNQICQNPQQDLDKYSSFSNSDAQLGVDVGRGRQKRYDFPGTISRCVDAMLQNNPNGVAIKDGHGNVLTYAQLAQQSNVIAAALSAAGTTIGSYVAVLFEPSSDTITSLLAILRLGAIYVPLDLQNPSARLALMTDNCRPSVIICKAATLNTAHVLGSQQMKVLNLSSFAEPEGVAAKDSSEADLPAFALYTSGSTGTPKGILLTQGNLMNSIYGTLEDQSLNRRETVLQQSSLGFDLSLYQIFRALTNGGILIVVPQAIRKDAAELSKLMLAENVTFTLATPSEYSLLLCYGGRYLKKCSYWKLACSAGENITSRLKQEFRQLAMPGLTLMNWFGPTEVGVFSSASVPYNDNESSAADEYPSIGRPLPNISVYIVDEHLQPVPIGFPGEICVCGASVGLRYIGHDVLTREKFVPNTFASTEDARNGWDRLYRSGDRGRILGDGSIIFLGRMDQDSQIKLRGFRIELEDVENTILHTAKGILTDAAVSVRGDPQILVSFVVFSLENSSSDTAGFLKQLSSELSLPPYMCPAMMIPLHHLPTTTNGKRDRAALDAIPLPASSGSDQQASLSDTESQLKSLWMKSLPDVIDISDIDKDTGFFHVGGSSILLMKLQALIYETFDVEVALMDLFQANTLRSMASRITAKYAQGPSEIMYDLQQEEEKREERSSIPDVTSQGIGPTSAFDLLENAIDWDSETAVSEELPELMGHSITPKAQSKCRVILLTGSTGLLGRAILHKLVEDSTVAKVHCIAVPMANEFSPTAYTPGYAKVETHVGSLSMPNLGLSEAEAETLSKEVDVIVHVGANGSFLNSYRTLRNQTLGATKYLARIALLRRIPIHFVSSNRVVLFAGSTTVGEISVARFYPPADGSDGLTAAKWACERYLENITEISCLPVWIHRSCHVISESAPPTDVLNALLKYSALLKAIPILENVEGFIDYAPVEIIADDIFLDIINTPQPLDQERRVTFIHHTSGRRITPQELKKHFEEQEGSPIEELVLTEWMSRAKKLGISELVIASLEALRTRREPVYFPLLLKKTEK